MKTTHIKGQLCLIDVDGTKEMEGMYCSMIKERLESYGVETLMPEEMITSLTGIPVSKMRNFIGDYGLPELIKFIDALKLTQAQKKKLQLLYAFNKVLNTSSFREKEILNSSNKAGEYFLKQLQFLRHEVFAVALLDAQNRLVGFENIFEGTINECAVYVRRIVQLVIERNANSIILGHNHPGGSPSPSTADIEVTKRISDALRTISVKAVDHIIICDDRFTSLAERGLI
jgi:DNA repair protein RadC